MAVLIFAVVLLLVWFIVGSDLGGSTTRPLPPDLPFLPQIDKSADSAAMSVPAPAETALTNVDPIDTEVGRAEAELAARLMTGQLLPAEYREAMAHLAASDTVSRPIVVPPGRSP